MSQKTVAFCWLGAISTLTAGSSELRPLGFGSFEENCLLPEFTFDNRCDEISAPMVGSSQLHRLESGGYKQSLQL